MLRRWRWCAVWCVILLLAIPGIAMAHPEIVRTEPAENAQLTTTPPEIRIVYNEAIEPAFSDIQLFNAQGEQVDDGGATVDPDRPNELMLPLSELPPNVYTVVWQTVGSDGHKVIGNFSFTLLGEPTPTSDPNATPEPTVATTPTPIPAAPAPLPPTIDSGPSPTLLAILRALMLLGALAFAGSLFVMLRVLLPALPPDAPAAYTQVLARWRHGAWQHLLLLLIAAGAFAVAQTATIASSVNATTLSAFFGTRLGQALLVRIGLALLLLVLVLTTRTLSRWRAALGLLLGLGLLLTFSMSGHAAAQNAPLLPVLADLLHMLATAVWIGGLVTLALQFSVLFGTLQTKERAETLAVVITRFSQLALTSVVVLALTGTYAALLHMQSFTELWTSEYGRALLVKLVVFGVLIALGAYNQLRIKPLFVSWVERLATSAVVKQWQRHFQTVVRSEVLLALLVIGAVGFLTNTAPPSSATASLPPTVATPAPDVTPSPSATPRPTRTPVPSEPFAEVQTIDDVQLGLEISPAVLGKNDLRVTVRDAAGQPVDVQRVVVSLEMLEMDMGINQTEVTQQAPGEYAVPDAWFSMVGEWQVRVEVRRADADDITTNFTVTIGG